MEQVIHTFRRLQINGGRCIYTHLIILFFDLKNFWFTFLFSRKLKQITETKKLFQCIKNDRKMYNFKFCLFYTSSVLGAIFLKLWFRSQKMAPFVLNIILERWKVWFNYFWFFDSRNAASTDGRRTLINADLFGNWVRVHIWVRNQ